MKFLKETNYLTQSGQWPQPNGATAPVSKKAVLFLAKFIQLIEIKKFFYNRKVAKNAVKRKYFFPLRTLR